ncbi:MAG: PD40 domain-containing protein [Anaerolineales bacterium]|nr:PD40 domain-containing protein [Anaerolineales bacterium]
MKVKWLVTALVFLTITGAIGIAYLVFSPELVSVSPQPGEVDVLAASPVRLTFSTTMQTESVEERLSFTPAVRGEFSWEERTLSFTPDQPWYSGESVTIHLQPGARSEGLIPLPLRGRHEWTFTISHTLLLYLSPTNGIVNLFAHDVQSGVTQQLTSSSTGLLDFSASPDGRYIYYSERNPTGGSDLIRMDRLGDDAGQPVIERLLACLHAFCHSAQVSPDGTYLAYEREPRPQIGQSLYSQVWLLALHPGNEIESGEIMNNPISQANHPTRSPAWSSTGWLSYYDLELKAFVLLNPVSGELLEFSNETGESGTWSPDGEAFVAPEIIYAPPPAGVEEFSLLAASHLLSFDLSTGEVHNLSQGVAIEDTFPVFSPDGNWLAFTRKFLDEARWTPGRQIWIVDVSTGAIQSLTDSPSFNHSNIIWNPDGEKIAYLRINLDHLTDPVELWIVEISTNEHHQIVSGAYSPLWIP